MASNGNIKSSFAEYKILCFIGITQATDIPSLKICAQVYFEFKINRDPALRELRPALWEPKFFILHFKFSIPPARRTIIR
jgi:hypothetical protein